MKYLKTKINFPSLQNFVRNCIFLVFFFTFLFVTFDLSAIYKAKHLKVDRANNRIPSNIYMFWDKGLDTMHIAGKVSLRSWKLMNPTFTVTLLNRTEIEYRTNRKSLIPDKIFGPLSIQAKSDIYRTLLIHKFGGIWVDATVQSNIPLLDWLNMNSSDLQTFRRYKHERAANNGIFIWITSWFLAAPKNSYTLGKVKDVLCDSSQWERFNKNLTTGSADYFWWHRIVSDLAKTDDRIRIQLDSFPSALANHCKVKPALYFRNAPVLKLCATGKMIRLIDTAEKCCPKKDNIEEGLICDLWDCSSLGENWRLVAAMEKIGKKRMKAAKIATARLNSKA